ncbi:MAG: GyrI-like domain-containing protein [Deltaproteobacteria bacterium]|nr:GyrI-like domain-containing protein [Deltaproteobacteria bacterium]
MKIDLVKEHKDYYRAALSPELTQFDGAKYVSIEGKGEPGGKEFTEKVEALYPVAYGIKKLCKEEQCDFAVPKLEGFWWVEGKRDARSTSRKEWSWKLLIRLPDFVTNDMHAKAVAEVVKRKKLNIAFETALVETPRKKCVQALHVGPYSEEPGTIDRLLSFVNEKGYKIDGLHHEIYLSDPRKTKAEELKTIIRYSIA